MNLEAARFIQKLEQNMPKSGKTVAPMEESKGEDRVSEGKREEPTKSAALNLEERIEAILEKKIGQFLSKREKEPLDDEEEEESTWDSLPKSPIRVEDETIKNKRSANEASVLLKILDVASFESGDDWKKKLVDIQLLARKRLFILELSEKVGWGVAAAYAELFPSDAKLVPSRLLKASEYFEMLGKVNSKVQKRGSGGNVGSAGKGRGRSDTIRNKSPGSYGECFRCGKKGHWARECPVPREPAKQ
ncbi:MAG: C2HC-type zinc finger protein [Vulcanimicrobiaceae bacterium]